MTPKLLEVMERAKRNPQLRFQTLAHLIDEEALKRAYDRIRKNAAVGVDGVTKEQYGEELESNVGTLHGRMKNDALPAPGAAPRAHPEGEGKDTPDRHLVHRGQGGTGRDPRGAASRLRTDLQ